MFNNVAGNLISPNLMLLYTFPNVVYALELRTTNIDVQTGGLIEHASMWARISNSGYRLSFGSSFGWQVNRIRSFWTIPGYQSHACHCLWQSWRQDIWNAHSFDINDHGYQGKHIPLTHRWSNGDPSFWMHTAEVEVILGVHQMRWPRLSEAHELALEDPILY